MSDLSLTWSAEGTVMCTDYVWFLPDLLGAGRTYRVSVLGKSRPP